MNISDNFKKYINENGRQITLRISYDDQVIEKKGIRSFTKTLQGDLYKSIMQFVDLELEGNIDIKNKSISVDFGVSYEDQSYEYIHWGTFVVDNESVEYSIEKNSTRLTAYDLLVKTHIQYDLQIVYPITVKEFLLKICERFGFTLINDSFINDSQILNSEKYIDIGEVTFRDVLDQIAGCTASIIYIYDNQLQLKYPTDINYVIDEHNMKSMNIQNKFGPINSVVLARVPQEDNYFKQDEISISQNGLTEIKLANNEIMDKNRENFIEEIFNQVNGFYFYPYEISTFGFCWFEPCDIVTIKDLSGHEYQTIILNDTITITTGITETLYLERPETATTDYSTATSSEKELHNTQLVVDKQNKVIRAEIEEQKSQIKKLNNSITVNLLLNYVNQQTYDEGFNQYYPDYTVNPLVITAITKDAIQDIITDASYVWKRKGLQDEDYVELINDELVRENKLFISHNITESVDYIVYAEVLTIDGTLLQSENHITINLNTLTDTTVKGNMCTIETTNSAFIEEDNNYSPGNITLIPHFFNCNFDVWSYSTDLGLSYINIIPISSINEDEETHVLETNVKGINFNSDTMELQIANNCECFQLTNIIVFKLKCDAEDANATTTITKESDIATQVNQIVTDMNQLNEQYNLVVEELNSVDGTITQKVEDVEKKYNGDIEVINKKLTTVIQTSESIEEQYQTLKEIIDETGSNLQTITTYIRKTAKGIEVGELEANVKTLMAPSYFSILFNNEEVMKLEQNLLTIERIKALSIFQLGDVIFTTKNNGFDMTWGGQ